MSKILGTRKKFCLSLTPMNLPFSEKLISQVTSFITFYELQEDSIHHPCSIFVRKFSQHFFHITEKILGCTSHILASSTNSVSSVSYEETILNTRSSTTGLFLSSRLLCVDHPYQFTARHISISHLSFCPSVYLPDLHVVYLWIYPPVCSFNLDTRNCPPERRGATSL